MSTVNYECGHSFFSEDDIHASEQSKEFCPGCRGEKGFRKTQPLPAAPPTGEETKYLKLLRWFKLFYKFYQDSVKDKPSACASSLAEDGELQEFIREANTRIL